MGEAMEMKPLIMVGVEVAWDMGRLELWTARGFVCSGIGVCIAELRGVMVTGASVALGVSMTWLMPLAEGMASAIAAAMADVGTAGFGLSEDSDGTASNLPESSIG